MKDFFRDVFEYHHHFNQRLANQLIPHQEILPNRTIPLFSHIINAHQIWNSRILNQQKLGVHEVHSLEKCKRLDTDNRIHTEQIIATMDLDQEINYATSGGRPYGNTIREVLFHIANHSSHHKGQIISDLRQSGIAPLKTDYIFYKR